MQESRHCGKEPNSWQAVYLSFHTALGRSLHTGINNAALTDGSATLLSGTDELFTGAGTLQTASGQVADGISQLADGAKNELADGTSEFEEKRHQETQRNRRR